MNIYIHIYRERGRDWARNSLIITLIMAHIIFFSNTPFPHSQHEVFAYIELLRLRHQHDCMGCWKVSLLISREFCYIVSHCASLSPRYYSSSSLLALVYFHYICLRTYIKISKSSSKSYTNFLTNERKWRTTSRLLSILLNPLVSKMPLK